MLMGCNPYVQTFLSFHGIVNEGAETERFKIVLHADKKPAAEHARRYNGPSCSEVAALIPGNEDGAVGKRDIVVRKRGVLNDNGNEVLHTVSVSHRSYDPLIYFLLLPSGADGWHPEMRFVNGKKRRKLTCLMLYSWRLYQRSGEFNSILPGCRLFQHYLVHQFFKMESERLSYVFRNQSNMRAESYSRLRELLGDAGGPNDESEAVQLGKPAVLPSIYVGRERYMRQKMHDITATSTKLGHPDIFLTMTCIPKWIEIQRSLPPGQTAQDRPYLCARVFKLKLQAFMDVVMQDKIFGKVIAHVRVTEFQKRGLPHAHCIFILDDVSKNILRSPEKVDEIIAAEIPSEEDAHLRRIVLQHMVHNPCGEHNPSAVCMGDKGSKKYFPKPFRPEMKQSENEHYISCRRRSPEDGGEIAKRPVRGKREELVDNSRVVAYSPKLMRTFKFHMNVELCVSRFIGIKYLFKYICKGNDRVTMQIIEDTGNCDEISHFQDARYVSASEAAWRLLVFDLVENSPEMYRLEVHTPNNFTVYFREDEQVQVAMKGREKKLMQWLEANKTYPEASCIKYFEFPQYFTCKQPEKLWKPRAGLRTSKESAAYDFFGPGEKVVGRMYTVSPRERERYFLRLLLLLVGGATSFEDIRAVHGVVCSSFREACVLRGLLADDDEWKRAIREAFSTKFVPLPHVLATILVYCQPADPLSLWNDQKSLYLQDISARHRTRNTCLKDDKAGLLYVLMEVQCALGGMGSFSLHSFQLPSPEEGFEPLLAAETAEEPITERCKKALQTSIPLLNDDQKSAFNAVVGCILPGVSSAAVCTPSHSPNRDRDGVSRVFFLDAPGGTGKKFVTRAIHDALLVREKCVLAVVTSAVAAVLLHGGRTAHSTFKIPIPCTAESTCAKAASQLAEEMHKVDLIIWDELVMCHRHCIEAVDRTLRDIMKQDKTFGGKCVLFSGDFRQILSVIPGGSPGQIVHSCARSSPIIEDFQVLELKENMRLPSLRRDPLASKSAIAFPAFLLKIGEGRDHGGVQLPESLQTVSTVRALCSAVFEGLEKNFGNVEWLTSRAMLTTKNSKIPEINRLLGSRVPGQYRRYLSADAEEDDTQAQLKYPVELLNSLIGGSSLPDHCLELKKGFMVMLLRNISPQKGHVNGTRYIVEGMSTCVLHLRVAVGSHAGARLTLPRVLCSPGYDNYPVPGFICTQFPVRMCFGMTVNKAQGQSFREKLGLDLSDDCFSHGQLYVGLSRVTDHSNVTVLTKTSTAMTKNVVYKEVLSSSLPKVPMPVLPLKKRGVVPGLPLVLARPSPAAVENTSKRRKLNKPWKFPVAELGLKSVREPEYVQDDAFNAFMETLKSETVVVMSCFFFLFLLRDGLSVGEELYNRNRNLRDLMERLGRCEKVFTPLHCARRFHWGLAVLDKRRREVMLYDSLPSMKAFPAFLLEIKDWAEAIPGLHGVQNCPPLWKIEEGKSYSAIQGNGVDYGVYVMLNALHVSRGISQPSVDASATRVIRLKIVECLETGSLEPLS